MTADIGTDTDVIIVGCGPVGTLLATLLGRRGVRVVVVERDSDVYPLPRAAHIDHQGLRLLQEIGCLDELMSQMLPNPGIEFLTADREVLMRLPGNQGSISGLPASMYFHQPGFDRTLRAAAQALPTVDVRLGAEMIGMLLSLDDATVTVRYEDGSIETIRGMFVVGCDGAWSPTRETIGSKFESLNFDERWLVVDLILQQRIETLPAGAVTLCDPARPMTLIPIPNDRFRLELQLLPGEDPERMQELSVVGQLISDWVPEGSATVERSTVYSFHGLIATPWRSGRALLAGDAAHQMPPFLGQGMCSGLRDAANLAWKLAHVIQRNAPLTLLDTYELERLPHVRHVVESAVRYGRLTCMTDPAEAAARDRQWLADKRPVTERLPFRLPSLEPGPLVLEGGGELFIQPRDENGVRLDDFVGQRFLVAALDEAALGTASREWWVSAVGALATTAEQLPGTVALKKWLRARNGEVAIIRPDRYVMAVGHDLDEVTSAIPSLLLAAELEVAPV